jgi:uncharacterized protein (TIGR02680 family)
VTERFRLARAGLLNVWQYDEQVFEFADGRLLLRGSNGAGKSKTLEMLLPFVLDGDKARMTASGRHHTSLLWLMLDGYGGQNRAGYLWVEFARPGETITCGVGIRASQSARTASAWFFTVPGRVGEQLTLEDEAGPLAKERLRVAVEAVGGHYFESARPYKEHVGRTLFGLEPTHYDELLRLLYWLRQPQVGEDIEPARLAEQLMQALPALDDEAIRAAGDTFDELAAFGEQLDRQRRSADGVAAFARVYADYAREVLRSRGAGLGEQHRERTKRASEVARCAAQVQRLAAEQDSTMERRGVLTVERTTLAARLTQLRTDPLLRTEHKLVSARELAAETERGAASAGEVARQAQARAQRSTQRVRRDADGLIGDLGAHAGTGRGHVIELARFGARVAVPAPLALHEPRLDVPEDGDAVMAGLWTQAEGIQAARPLLGELRAAVEVVDAARRECDTASARRQQAEQTAAEAEQRAEESRGLRAAARAAATRVEAAFTEAFDAWRADPMAVPFEAPAQLTAEALAGLSALARTAAAPVLSAHREDEKAAGASRAASARELIATQERRAQVAAERDPAPPNPAWSRDSRDGVAGAPFWRLVDFAPELTEADRAGLEAALESSGLLDAWISPDGAVLEAGRLDTLLPAGPAVYGASLASALLADVPAESGLLPEVVFGVLARIGRADTPADGHRGAEPEATAMLGVDGSWRLGPLTGRASKSAAQYIGATARVAERARRLAELDEQIAVLTAARDEAAAAEAVAHAAADAIEVWLGEAPPTTEVVEAWTRLAERDLLADRADRRAREAEEAAGMARAVEAERRAALTGLATAHGLPTEADALAARREALLELDRALARHGESAAALVGRVTRWSDDALASASDLAEAQNAAEAAALAGDRAAVARAAAAELEATIGAPVLELRRRIEGAEREDDELAREAAALDSRIATLLGDAGAARQAARAAADRVTEHEPALVDAVTAVATLGDTPGLLESGSVRPPDGVLDQARAYLPGQPVPAGVLALGRELAALDPPAKGGTETAVYAAWQEAASGPAGDVDPRVVEDGGALAVIGSDDAGEHPIGILAERLAAAVARDAELLTERERRLFEEHVLGDLGESLRARRQQSEELVTEMNSLLRGVTTSQGIAVALRWALRDDVAADARRAVDLLGRPVGALLSEERRELRDALHRLIEASRADAPEDSYAEHLARALDYRRWFAFRIRYTRPETAGTWHDLHRRSPLSQGEQKVVCYLPLFAAAAAHFSSLAGAAPYSPRFVLLDDAFPKIDVRTHPLLFGLLVQLDLDFVITSERLWGDHATVPSLAIYEALRDPNERGIAQYRHTWDGHRLQAVGA